MEGKETKQGCKIQYNPREGHFTQAHRVDLQAVRAHLRIVLWRQGARAFMLPHGAVPRGHKISGTSGLLPLRK